MSWGRNGILGVDGKLHVALELSKPAVEYRDLLRWNGKSNVIRQKPFAPDVLATSLHATDDVDRPSDLGIERVTAVVSERSELASPC